jgi:GrpB-like predicted nucleotidyltransferase (UPF0157 family)
MERYGGGSIVVSDYDPAWSAMFEDERANLRPALGPLALTIEHIGSTAVPGLPAKPIIDLQASVRSLAEAKSHFHVLQEDNPRWEDRLLFRDYLRSHPKAARAYAKLKRDLAAAFDDDISGYRNAKDAFVAAAMDAARAGR